MNILALAFPLLLQVCGIESSPGYVAESLANTTCEVCAFCQWDWAVMGPGIPTAHFTWMNIDRSCAPVPAGCDQPDAPCCVRYRLETTCPDTTIWACTGTNPGVGVFIVWE